MRTDRHTDRITEADQRYTYAITIGVSNNNNIIIIIIFNPRKTRVKKIKKSTKRFEVEKLVRVVLRGKTIVQQYGVKTLNSNRNALK